MDRITKFADFVVPRFTERVRIDNHVENLDSVSMLSFTTVINLFPVDKPDENQMDVSINTPGTKKSARKAGGSESSDTMDLFSPTPHQTRSQKAFDKLNEQRTDPVTQFEDSPEVFSASEIEAAELEQKERLEESRIAAKTNKNFAYSQKIQKVFPMPSPQITKAVVVPSSLEIPSTSGNTRRPQIRAFIDLSQDERTNQPSTSNSRTTYKRRADEDIDDIYKMNSEDDIVNILPFRNDNKKYSRSATPPKSPSVGRKKAKKPGNHNLRRIYCLRNYIFFPI